MTSMDSEIANKIDSNNLGRLVELPVELRSMIWQNMRPQNDCESKSDLNILRTCHQLYDEVSQDLYGKEILNFNISPLYEYRSWIRVSNQLGAVWSLSSLQDAISLGFDKLPYHKLEEINMNIQAPDRTDPGQMVCLWRKVREFAELLSQVEKLPGINIYLQNTKHAKWSENGQLQRSIPAEGTINYAGDFDFDCEIVLYELCRLRNARKAKIHVPEDLILKHENNISNHQSLMMHKEPFGTYLDLENDGTWCDSGYQEDIDDNFRMFDLALDELPGKPASMLRLQRFSSWYDDNKFTKSRYMDELERLIKLPVYTTVDYNNVNAIRWRYRLMLAFNPLSTKMREMRFQNQNHELNLTPDQLFEEFPAQLPYVWTPSQWIYYYRETRHVFGRKEYKYKGLDTEDSITEQESDKSDGRTEEGLGSEDRWDPEEWHRYYPEGIPPLGQNLIVFEIEMGHSGSEKLPIEPRERFRGWGDFDLPWEYKLKKQMFEKVMSRRRRSSGCSSCGL